MPDQIQPGALGEVQTGAPASSPTPSARRLAYIDWLRGFACVGMFQAHCYNSWLSPDARKGHWYEWSQALATVPAPLFIFLSGISFAMVTQRLRETGAARGEIARTTILRGLQIFGLGVLFRMQEFALGYPNAPWTDLLRVDVLNILGLSMILMGVLCWATSSKYTEQARKNAVFAALVAALIIAVATPWLWTSYRPTWLPWPLE